MHYVWVFSILGKLFFFFFCEFRYICNAFSACPDMERLCRTPQTALNSSKTLCRMLNVLGSRGSVALGRPRSRRFLPCMAYPFQLFTQLLRLFSGFFSSVFGVSSFFSAIIDSILSRIFCKSGLSARKHARLYTRKSMASLRAPGAFSYVWYGKPLLYRVTFFSVVSCSK